MTPPRRPIPPVETAAAPSVSTAASPPTTAGAATAPTSPTRRQTPRNSPRGIARGEVGAEGHDGAASEAVPETGEQPHEQERPKGSGERHQHEAGGEHKQAGNDHPLAAPAVHDHADGIEHEHVDGGGEAEDEADLEGVEADGAPPDGDEELASVADEHEGDGHRARHEQAAAPGEDNAAQAHAGAFRGAGIAGPSPGEAGRHEQGGRTDHGGLSKEDRLQAARLAERAADDGSEEEADAGDTTHQRQGAAAVLNGHGLGHVGEAGDVPEGEGDAVEQGEPGEHSGNHAEAHGNPGAGRQQNAGGHREPTTKAAREQARGYVADHRAGAAGGEDEAAEEDARAKLLGEQRDGRDDHPLADAEEEGGEVDAADQ